MCLKILIISMFLVGNVFGSEDALLKLDPTTIESIREMMPEAVIVDKVAYQQTNADRREIGPRFKENVRINVDVLIPQMIKIMQDQQAEIEKLKVQKRQSGN